MQAPARLFTTDGLPGGPASFIVEVLGCRVACDSLLTLTESSVGRGEGPSALAAGLGLWSLGVL